jgi:hypothetical protein
VPIFVPKILLETICRESVEAVYRVCGAVESLEKMINPC